MLTRVIDPNVLRSILDHPAMHCEIGEDIDAMVSNPNNICLAAEYGTMLFIRYFEGIYEADARVLPMGRGEWSKEFAESAIRYMFCGTDAIEILSHVPEGRVASAAACRMMGGRVQFHRRDKSATVYSLPIQDWWPRADGLIQRGIEFRDWMRKQGSRFDVLDDEHARVLGVTAEMILEARTAKAVVFYNRWGLSTRQPVMPLHSLEPFQVGLGDGVLSVENSILQFSLSH